MNKQIKEIALRDPESITEQIDSLEKEILPDTAPAKKSYAANVIRLDIANLQRDVNILAMGVAEIATRMLEIENTLIIVGDCLARNINLMKGLLGDKSPDQSSGL